jgi:hypothetical protein
MASRSPHFQRQFHQSEMQMQDFAHDEHAKQRTLDTEDQYPIGRPMPSGRSVVGRNNAHVVSDVDVNHYVPGARTHTHPVHHSMHGPHNNIIPAPLPQAQQLLQPSTTDKQPEFMSGSFRTNDLRSGVIDVELRPRNGAATGIMNAAVLSGSLRGSQSNAFSAEYPNAFSKGETFVTVPNDLEHPEARMWAQLDPGVGLPAPMSRQIPDDSYDVFGRDMQLHVDDNNLYPRFQGGLYSH